MLSSGFLHRTVSAGISDVLPCLSYSKRIVLQQNFTANYHKVLSYKIQGSNRNTKVIEQRPQIPVTLLPPKFFSNSALNKCWHCGKEHHTCVKFCEECKKLQPLDRTVNYFEVMGINKSFTVDTKSLTKTFRKLQTEFHPDKFSISLEIEQQYAVDHSSEINKAYRCLLHPVERALYLLDLAGQPLHEGQLDMDPEFLMEIMEVNEELEEATDKEAVANIGQKNQKILDGLLQEADAAFSANNIESARDIVAKIKYYNNIYLKIRDYERQHGIID